MSSGYRAQKPKIISEIDSLIEHIRHRLQTSNLIGQNKKLPILKQPKNIVGGQIKDYQLESLAWMVELANNNLSGILADDMGLGKTIQAITYMSYIQDHKKINGKHLIIVPKNVLNNWKRELEKWNPSFNVVCLPGTEEYRYMVLKTYIRPSKFDILIATYYSVQVCENVLKKISWETLIVDEAHSIKNSYTCLATCLRKFRSNFSLLLTGTPLSNDLSELWSLLNFIAPYIFSDSYLFQRIETSVDQYCSTEYEKIKYQSYIAARFKAVINPFMLRRVKSYINLGLKYKKYITLFVSLSELQITMYRNYLKTRSVYADENRTQQSKSMQLRKICAHPYLFDGIYAPDAPPYGYHLIEVCGKLKLLDKLLSKLLRYNHKILIFSQYVILLKILYDYCTYRSHKYYIITGESTLDYRDQSIDRFTNTKDTNIFLISTRAGGIGLNLVAADIVIMYDLDWNPQMDKQAMDRAYRIGQKNNVTIFKLVCNNTVEERILYVQKYKLIWDYLVIQKGGLARIKNAEEKFYKMDINKIAGLGAYEIFKIQHNYDENTIEEIIKMGEYKDQKKTEEIRKKLYKYFANLNTDNLNPYSFYEDKGYGLDKVEFKPKYLGEVKLDKRIKTNTVSRRTIEPKPHHLYDNTRKAGELLFSIYYCLEDEDKYKMISELRELGFYDWTIDDYLNFVEANMSILKTNYSKISNKIYTKTPEQVKYYSEKFYKVGESIPALIKDYKKLTRRQKYIYSYIYLKQLETKIKNYSSDLFNLKQKCNTNCMTSDSYIRLYFSDLKSKKENLPKHEYLLYRFNHGIVTKLKKHVQGANQISLYKKVVEIYENSKEKPEEILETRYQALFEKYYPEKFKGKAKTKSVVKIYDNKYKDEESVETYVKVYNVKPPKKQKTKN